MGTWLIVLGAVALNLWLGYNYAKSQLPYKLKSKKEEHEKRWPTLKYEDGHDKEDLMFWFGLTTMFPWFMIPLEWCSKHISNLMENDDD